jgi:hypothetical protein
MSDSVAAHRGVHARHAGDERQGALKLSEGGKQPAIVEARQLLGTADRGYVHGGMPNADALECEQQHAKPRERTDCGQHRGVVVRLRVAEHPLAKSQLVDALSPVARVERHDHLRQPRCVDQAIVRG